MQKNGGPTFVAGQQRAKILGLTTFNEKGRALYGQRMLDSFVDKWPEEARLRVYAEGWAEQPQRWQVYDLLTASPWLADFKRAHKDDRRKGFRYAAVRFSHKIAALTHADQMTDADFLIWLDGDLLLHEPISLDELLELAPRHDQWIAWLDRKNMYPECGFYIINRRHEHHSVIMHLLEERYTTGELFTLREWHDSFVMMQLVQSTGVLAKSISGNGFTTTHPLINGPLGKWFDHLKGNRKGKRRSPDLRTQHDAPHWRNK